MSQLLKYYESDDTIYLLIEYYPLGRLYSHLNQLVENPDNFVDSLKTSRRLTRQDSTDSRDSLTRRRNSLSTFKLNYSFSSAKLGDIQQKEIVSKRRTYSEIPVSTVVQSISSDSSEQIVSKLTEVKISDIKFIDDSLNQDILVSSSSISSSSSESDLSTSKSSQAKVEFLNLNNTTVNKDKWSLNLLKQKLNRQQSAPVAFFNKTSAENSKTDQSDAQTIKKEYASSEEEPNKKRSCSKQIKLWLAQLVCALKNLHNMDILCKDLNSENLLINQNGQLVLTFFSKWNLVDERLNLQAINDFYVAPGNFYVYLKKTQERTFITQSINF